MWASLLSGSIQERVDERASKYPIKERAELSWAGCEKRKGCSGVWYVEEKPYHFYHLHDSLYLSVTFNHLCGEGKRAMEMSDDDSSGKKSDGYKDQNARKERVGRDRRKEGQRR